MPERRAADPPLCRLREAVDEFLRVFQVSCGEVEVLDISGGIVQLRVRCPPAGCPNEDLLRLRLKQHLQLRFPCLRGAVIQFAASETAG